jgi:hypothetical protein
MDILKHLATALNRRDEVPNQELAKKIVKTKDEKAVKDLVENLRNKDKNIQADCIKVLYEIGVENPSLIKKYINDFVALLYNKNNRLVWGGMHALNTIASEDPASIYKLLPKLIDVANSGSVITRDNLVMILIKLEGMKTYKGKVFPLLVEQMKTCPPNQLAMYADNSISIVNDSNKVEFIRTLQQRLPDIDRDTMKNRIMKVIKRFSAKN